MAKMDLASLNLVPLIGSEEGYWAIPVPMDLTIFGGPPGCIIPIEHPEGFLHIQPRCWWEPIEDEE